MSKKKDITEFDVIHEICSGLDVHKKKISACISITHTDGSIEHLIQEFGTKTKDLYNLRDWLMEHNCLIVAMESTGIYWRPVHNVLENDLIVKVVNAKHIKNLPGRKTDIADCKWLSTLLRVGLISASFIPPKDVRQFRELVAVRKSITKSLGDYKRRVHKLFDGANIKISTEATDLFGKTGRNLMALLLDPEIKITSKMVADCAKGSLKKKVPDLRDSIHGFFEDHHRYQLQILLDIIDFLQPQINDITSRLENMMVPHQELLDRLIEVYGVEKLAAQSILGHVGYTLEEFANEANFVSWAGLCPGNNESAGKRKSGKSPVRKHGFKTLLVEISWAAVKAKGSFYRAKYFRLKVRIGAKKAIIAIAHKIAIAIYHIIKHGDRFKDLGERYLAKKYEARKVLNLHKQAKDMGFDLVKLNLSDNPDTPDDQLKDSQPVKK